MIPAYSISKESMRPGRIFQADMGDSFGIFLALQPNSTAREAVDDVILLWQEGYIHDGGGKPHIVRFNMLNGSPRLLEGHLSARTPAEHPTAHARGLDELEPGSLVIMGGVPHIAVGSRMSGFELITLDGRRISPGNHTTAYKSWDLLHNYNGAAETIASYRYR